MRSKTFRTKIVREGSMCFVPLTFDPKAVFGKVRAPAFGEMFRRTLGTTPKAWASALEKAERGSGFELRAKT
jgi:hypothetical protein